MMDPSEKNEDGDLTDLLGELRVLLPGAQLLTAFLTSVPFTPGFAAIIRSEKLVFLATFLLSISALVLLSAPAVQHRLMRPLRDRGAFKHLATREIVIGACLLALSLVLVTQLILSEVLGPFVGNVVAGLVALLIAVLWWLLPRRWRNSGVI